MQKIAPFVTCESVSGLYLQCSIQKIQMGDMGQHPTGNVSEEPRPQGAFPWLWRWGSPLPKMSRFQSPDSLTMGQEVVISLCLTYEP